MVSAQERLPLPTIRMCEFGRHCRWTEGRSPSPAVHSQKFRLPIPERLLSSVDMVRCPNQTNLGRGLSFDLGPIKYCPATSPPPCTTQASTHVGTLFGSMSLRSPCGHSTRPSVRYCVRSKIPPGMTYLQIAEGDLARNINRTMRQFHIFLPLDVIWITV